MKRIPLTKGYWTTVDDEDYPQLAIWSWYALTTKGGQVYAARRVSDGGGKSHVELMRRVIVGASTTQHVDHRNHDTLDNTRLNLRPGSARDNQGNSRKLKPKTSKYKGVYWLNSRSRWVSEIRTQGGKRRIGSFKSEEEAALAYDVFARKHFGDFALTNFGDLHADQC